MRAPYKKGASPREKYGEANCVNILNSSGKERKPFSVCLVRGSCAHLVSLTSCRDDVRSRIVTGAAKRIWLIDLIN